MKNCRDELLYALETCTIPQLVRDTFDSNEGAILSRGFDVLGVVSEWKYYPGMGGVLLEKLGDESAHDFLNMLRVASMQPDYFYSFLAEKLIEEKNISNECKKEIDFLKSEIAKRLPLQEIYSTLVAEIGLGEKYYKSFSASLRATIAEAYIDVSFASQLLDTCKMEKNCLLSKTNVASILIAIEKASNALVMPIYHNVILDNEDLKIYSQFWRESKEFFLKVVSYVDKIHYMMDVVVFEYRFYDMYPIDDFLKVLMLKVEDYLRIYKN